MRASAAPRRPRRCLWTRNKLSTSFPAPVPFRQQSARGVWANTHFGITSRSAGWHSGVMGVSGIGYDDGDEERRERRTRRDMRDGSGFSEQRPTRCVYKGGKSQANIEHLGGGILPFDQKMASKTRRRRHGRGREQGGYWSSLAGFIHHGRRFFFAIFPPEHHGLLSSREGRGLGAFSSLGRFTPPSGFNQFVSRLACSFRGRTTHSTIDEGTE
jgi:hypothetical protein